MKLFGNLVKILPKNIRPVFLIMSIKQLANAENFRFLLRVVSKL